MASSPSFTSTPRAAVAAVSTANTNRDGTGTIVDVLTAAAEGTILNKIVVKATADPADSTVTIFLYNGSSYFIFDEIDLQNPAAASATVPSFRAETTYSNVWLPGSTWKVAAAITASLTAGVMNVWVFGADLT